MSKFIKVTDLESGWDIIIFTHRISGIVPHHQSGSIITGVDGKNIEVVESLEQIEAQLLRDDFAMRAMNAVLVSTPIFDSRKASKAGYLIADAMIKERMK